MSIPDAAEIPAKVAELAQGWSIEPVWRNKLGGVTFRIERGTSVRFVKHTPRDPEVSVDDEAERLAWAARWIAVPRVVAHGADGAHEWIVTEAVAGENAVSPRWTADPETAVRALGSGLRAMHDALPVDGCPFDWGVASRVANAAERGIEVPGAFRSAPPIDRLVVCHGDACAPNTLLADDGSVAAHVDLGALGVADRWADLAPAILSCGWNYGEGWGDTLLEAYGVERDDERLAFYTGLWNET
ncbi:aminoglycoside 3'-phosphotransferase [Microbacterium indicum]|uniref:aminoglycoside 3'-phosphotransferase n=1 Tax=Microbacterium indicum TaxID=358100 RepID=UPI00041DEC0A|nr:aminoglycoside 3'-phosphotransferase [Microbacterium indicum]